MIYFVLFFYDAVAWQMVLVLVLPGLTHGAALNWGLSWKSQDGPTRVSGIGTDYWLGHLSFSAHGLSSSNKLNQFSSMVLLGQDFKRL